MRAAQISENDPEPGMVKLTALDSPAIISSAEVSLSQP
jgi:hypothetical protein